MGRRQLTWRGRACRGAGRPGTGLSDYDWGHRALVVTRGSVPARTDGLGAVAGGFPEAAAKFSFPNHPSSQPLPIEAAVFLDARSGHHLNTTCAGGARLHAPRTQPLYPLRGLGFPERKALEILGHPNWERKPVSLEKKNSVVVKVCLYCIPGVYLYFNVLASMSTHQVRPFGEQSSPSTLGEIKKP